LVSPECLIGGLKLRRGLHRMDIPMFPLRLPWIAPTSTSIEVSLIAFDVPGISDHHRTGHQPRDHMGCFGLNAEATAAPTNLKELQRVPFQPGGSDTHF